MSLSVTFTNGYANLSNYQAWAFNILNFSSSQLDGLGYTLTFTGSAGNSLQYTITTATFTGSSYADNYLTYPASYTAGVNGNVAAFSIDLTPLSDGKITFQLQENSSSVVLVQHIITMDSEPRILAHGTTVDSQFNFGTDSNSDKTLLTFTPSNTTDVFFFNLPVKMDYSFNYSFYAKGPGSMVLTDNIIVSDDSNNYVTLQLGSSDTTVNVKSQSTNGVDTTGTISGAANTSINKYSVHYDYDTQVLTISAHSGYTNTQLGSTITISSCVWPVDTQAYLFVNGFSVGTDFLIDHLILNRVVLPELNVSDVSNLGTLMYTRTADSIPSSNPAETNIVKSGNTFHLAGSGYFDLILPSTSNYASETEFIICVKHKVASSPQNTSLIKFIDSNDTETPISPSSSSQHYYNYLTYGWTTGDNVFLYENGVASTNDPPSKPSNITKIRFGDSMTCAITDIQIYTSNVTSYQTDQYPFKIESISFPIVESTVDSASNYTFNSNGSVTTTATTSTGIVAPIYTSLSSNEDFEISFTYTGADITQKTLTIQLGTNMINFTCKQNGLDVNLNGSNGSNSEDNGGISTGSVNMYFDALTNGMTIHKNGELKKQYTLADFDSVITDGTSDSSAATLQIKAFSNYDESESAPGNNPGNTLSPINIIKKQSGSQPYGIEAYGTTVVISDQVSSFENAFSFSNDGDGVVTLTPSDTYIPDVNSTEWLTTFKFKGLSNNTMDANGALLYAVNPQNEDDVLEIKPDGSKQLTVNHTAAATDQTSTVIEVIVTVGAKNSSASDTNSAGNIGFDNCYFLGSYEKPILNLEKGKKYHFLQNDSTNSGHPLLFYTDDVKTYSISDANITVTSVGTPGSSGAYTEIIIGMNYTEYNSGVIYYQCGNDVSNHENMGNSANISTKQYVFARSTATDEITNLSSYNQVSYGWTKDSNTGAYAPLLYFNDTQLFPDSTTSRTGDASSSLGVTFGDLTTLPYNNYTIKYGRNAETTISGYIKDIEYHTSDVSNVKKISGVAPALGNIVVAAASTANNTPSADAFFSLYGTSNGLTISGQSTSQMGSVPSYSTELSTGDIPNLNQPQTFVWNSSDSTWQITNANVKTNFQCMPDGGVTALHPFRFVITFKTPSSFTGYNHTFATFYDSNFLQSAFVTLNGNTLQLSSTREAGTRSFQLSPDTETTMEYQFYHTSVGGGADRKIHLLVNGVQTDDNGNSTGLKMANDSGGMTGFFIQFLSGIHYRKMEAFDPTTLP